MGLCPVNKQLGISKTVFALGNNTDKIVAVDIE